LPAGRAHHWRIAVIVTGLVLVAGVVGSSAPSSAATSTFSLDRLRIGGAAGAENYVFTAGDTVYPQGGVDPGSYYRFVVTDAASTIRRAAVLSPARQKRALRAK
jgi:hypothetical protein